MSGITRREAIAAGAALGASFAPHVSGAQDGKVIKKGKLKQGAALWCWESRGVKLEQLCKEGAKMGLSCVDIVYPEQWKIVRDAGLVPTTGRLKGASVIHEGVNDPKFHDRIVKAIEEYVPQAAAEGVPDVILFYGNRKDGMSDTEAIENSVACLNRCKAAAEANKVSIVLEILNSKVNHKGYIGDNSNYCLAVVKGVNSPYVKLLYDIYHAQIMEGDVIRTIQTQNKWIGHYHTGGNPGREDIDETQELYYPAISQAVLRTGYTGYYVHEFIPRKSGDPIQSLRRALEICDVDV
jgi:hydroxypyruvate isomerase